MAEPRKYPDEVPDRAVRLVRGLVQGEANAVSVTGVSAGR